ncbi:hypothetical protein MHLNE_09060 [Moorella humiferrea]|uniref:hypothetical protein n=1 Tax=Neomoorella humiferrea TaxID=676965 RepID=UPI0030D2EBF4
MEIITIDEFKQFDALNELKRSNSTKEWSYPAQMKPCIAILLVNGEIGPTNVDDAGFMIIQELGRLGASDDEIRKNMEEWNKKLIARGATKCLRPSDIEGKIRYLRRHPKGDRRPGCNHFLSTQICIGKDSCMFYQKLVRDSKPMPLAALRRNNFEKFWELWRGKVNATDICVYKAICDLEKIRGVGIGGTIFVSRDQMVYYSGIAVNSVFTSLKRLEKYGLIKVKIGQARSNIATEIQRIVPIPKPLT